MDDTQKKRIIYKLSEEILIYNFKSSTITIPWYGFHETKCCVLSIIIKYVTNYGKSNLCTKFLLNCSDIPYYNLTLKNKLFFRLKKIINIVNWFHAFGNRSSLAITHHYAF